MPAKKDSSVNGPIEVHTEQYSPIVLLLIIDLVVVKLATGHVVLPFPFFPLSTSQAGFVHFFSSQRLSSTALSQSQLILASVLMIVCIGVASTLGT